MVRVERLTPENLHLLTSLFEYHDVNEMISACSSNIQNGIIDIYGLYEGDVLIGELRVKYESGDEHFTVRGKRAYLYAFRIREDVQNKGYGTYLLKTVLSGLEERGYREFTVGVEDDNARAIHMYQALGFDEILLRKQESYQGDVYEYNLYIRRNSTSNIKAL